MRFKQIWDYLPLPAKLKLFWQRITFSRITTFYFIFSVAHCFVQVVFQVQAFSINAQAAAFLFKIIEQGNAFDPGFAVLTPSNLRFCHSVPTSLSVASCQVVWNGTASNDTTVLGDVANGAASISTSSPATSTFSSSVSFVPVSAVSSPETELATSIPATGSTSTTAVVLALSTSASTPTPTKQAVTETVTKFVAPTSSVMQITELASAIGAAANSTPSTEALSINDDNDVDDVKEEHNHKRHSDQTEIMASQVNGTTVVTIDDPSLGWDNKKVLLDQSCLWALNWPVETLENTKREDITFISFQFWVLGMSIVAILNESMPHIIASLLTHIMATGWGAFQIFHTASFRTEFTRLTTHGACQPINLLPNYWKQRADAEIPSLALNALALLVSAFLSWRLIKLFGWQTFKRVGASRSINRIYKLVLSLSIAIQLSIFFIVVSIALWIDQLCNGDIGALAVHGKLYKGILITVLLILPPWLALGWVSVRRELRIQMLIFLVLSTLYLAGWGGMFASVTFRWTFVLWRFYSIVASASVILTLITLVLGVMCRMNFGKGLPHFLNAQEVLPGDDFIPETPDFEYDGDPEKVEFPTTNGPVPTFSVAFGNGEEALPPNRMHFGPPRLGPRFTNPSLEPFEPQLGEMPCEVEPAHLRSASTASSRSVGSTRHGARELTRHATSSSQHSFSSFNSNKSSESYRSDTSYGQRSRRWVIE